MVIVFSVLTLSFVILEENKLSPQSKHSKQIQFLVEGMIPIPTMVYETMLAALAIP